MHNCEYKKLIERLVQNFSDLAAYNAGDRSKNPEEINNDCTEIVLEGQMLLEAK